MTADATTPIPDGDAQTDADVLPDAHRATSSASGVNGDYDGDDEMTTERTPRYMAGHHHYAIYGGARPDPLICHTCGEPFAGYVVDAI